MQTQLLGRERELAWLRLWHRDKRHVLLFGPSQVGKSQLVGQIASEGHTLYRFPPEDTLGGLYLALEEQLGLLHCGLEPGREERLLKELSRVKAPLVLDGIPWGSRSLAAFIEKLMTCIPVWICTSSPVRAPDGRLPRVLAPFQKLPVRPFTLTETRSWLKQEFADEPKLRAEVLSHAAYLHRLAKGLPGVLRHLAARIGTDSYDLSWEEDRRLLEIDLNIGGLLEKAERRKRQRQKTYFLLRKSLGFRFFPDPGTWN